MEANLIFLLLMFAGLFAAILSGMPAMVAIGGLPLLVAGLGIFSGVFDPAFLQAFPQRVLGMMGNQLFVALPLFIFMGLILQRAGLAQAMLEAAGRLSGNSKTSLGFSVLGISTLIAATTGIVGATIVMLGTISYPALVRSGYSPKLASGLVVSAGTLGQIIPPSIVLIILADQISNAYQEVQRSQGVFAVEQVTVSDVFAGALLPGLILAIFFALYLAWRLRGDPSTLMSAEYENSEHVTFDLPIAILLTPVFLILAVLGSIVFGIATPSEAASIGAVGTVLLAGWFHSSGNRFSKMIIQSGLVCLIALAFVWALPNSFRVASAVLLSVLVGVAIITSLIWLTREEILKPTVTETIYLAGMIFGIVIAASMLSLVFRGFEGDTYFAELAMKIPGEKWGALLVVMLIVFLLGFFLEFIEIVFITIPIVGPVLLAMDFHPVWLAVLFAINLQTSFLTPPFGVALFYFKSVAPASFQTGTLYKAIVPFVFLQLLVLLVVALFSQLALFLPKILFG